ncbi:DUF1304 family protein [Oceanitalea stevensii]|uniref:DUF1304 family protein n=1 Tax=Oceanitalea stevensii TaxID=2763072 RepID=A0ABR8Z5A9_9MICO|nr:DUF1304 family protein [Oceanitalea stevensii]MBD8063362.1 DUF1304 family protein [Oceanitalea stevensii]
MSTFAQICAALAAVIVIAVSPLEAFYIHRPRVQRFLGIEPDGLSNVHLWSFCIGARNALVGVGTLVGLGMVNLGDPAAGTVLVVACLVYLLLSSLSMGLADALGYWRPRGKSVKGTVASSVLPAAALVAVAL